MGSELGWGSARWLFGSMWLTSLLQLLSWLPGLGWKVQEASFTFLEKCGSFTWPLLIQQSSLSIFMVDASKTNSGSHQTSWGLALEVTQYHFCICSIDKSPGQARFPWEKKWISSLDGWSSMYIQGGKELLVAIFGDYHATSSRKSFLMSPDLFPTKKLQLLFWVLVRLILHSALFYFQIAPSVNIWASLIPKVDPLVYLRTVINKFG